MVEYVKPAPVAEHAACTVTYATPVPVAEHVVQQLPTRHLPLWSCTSFQSPSMYRAYFLMLAQAPAVVLPVATVSMCCPIFCGGTNEFCNID